MNSGRGGHSRHVGSPTAYRVFGVGSVLSLMGPFMWIRGLRPEESNPDEFAWIGSERIKPICANPI